MAKSNQLKKGIRIESEHTKGKLFLQKKNAKTRKSMQKLITKDHIKEDPKYYTHLEEMERKAKQSKHKNKKK